MPMKQRITPEQLHELTDAQKERLRKWWMPSYGDLFTWEWHQQFEGGKAVTQVGVFIDEENHSSHEPSEDSLPLLSIGQMIEFIETKEYPTLHIDKVPVQGMMEHDRYEVFQQGRGTSQGLTLCEALWAAVKKIL